MKRAIVIGSYHGSPWLVDCLASLPKNIPALVVCEYGYECGKLSWIMRNTILDEFLFLPDTTIVKTHEWIYQALSATNQSFSVNAEPGVFGSFMGKYTRAILGVMQIPVTIDKWSAVLAEAKFGEDYVKLAGRVDILFPELRTGDKFEERHGRMNAVLENEHIVKYKGAFDADSLSQCEEHDKLIRP